MTRTDWRGVPFPTLAEPPALDVERLAKQLRAALIAVPYHANPKLPPGHPFGYPPTGHHEYDCPVCQALAAADDAFGEYDYASDPRHAAALATGDEP